MSRASVHFYEVPVPGIYHYLKTVQAEIINVTENDQLCIQATALVDGQRLSVSGGRSSGARVWKHFEYPKGRTR